MFNIQESKTASSDGQHRYQLLVRRCAQLVSPTDFGLVAQRFIDCCPTAADARLMTASDLKRLKTMGPPAVVKLLPMLELGLLVARAPLPVLGHAYSSAELGEGLAQRYAGVSAECVTVLLLNVHNEIIAIEPLFLGGFDECPVYTSRLFQLAVKYGAHSLVLAHNHPSGDWQPSSADLQFCERLSRAAKLLNLTLTDFLVVGNGGYYSWREDQADANPANTADQSI